MKTKDNTLPLIEKREELLRNVKTLDLYLDKSKYEYAKGLIGRGHCFVVVPSQDGYRFYPSRFMGYIENSMESHEKMGKEKIKTGKSTRNGGETNRAISVILGKLIKTGEKEWDFWEAEYQKFCEKLDIIPVNRDSSPDNMKRQFWPPISK